MELLKGYLSNTVIAILAAVFSILQEVWIDTPINFLTFFALGSSCAIALSFGTEIAKCIAWERKWSWNDVIFGSIAGIIAALAVTFICIL